MYLHIALKWVSRGRSRGGGVGGARPLPLLEFETFVLGLFIPFPLNLLPHITYLKWHLFYLRHTATSKLSQYQRELGSFVCVLSQVSSSNKLRITSLMDNLV